LSRLTGQLIYSAPVESPTGKTRRFESAGQIARDAAGLAFVSPTLWRVYRGGLSPALRERIMVGVSRANACAGCSRAHERWALRAGVTDEELDALGLDDLTRLDPASRAAVVYAVERSAAGFPGPLGAPSDDPEVAAEVASHFTPEQVENVDAIARGMTFANLSVGTAEALRERIGF
jgi:AhpD family alkylhydroperoxidase